MNTTLFSKPTLVALAVVTVIAAPALAFAANTAGVGAAVNTSAAVTAPGASVTASATITTKMKTGMTHADQEIKRRIDALTALSTRVTQMQKVTDAFKQSLQTSVQGQVSSLTNLQAKIDADTDEVTLKADVQTVKDDYRVFALVVPQGRIAAAADRAVTISGMMTTLGTKLQSRIAAEQAAGHDVTALSASLADLSLKIGDATTQAQQAVTLSAALAPDQGDKTKMASNTAALKSARADLALTQKDLVAARKDITTIMSALKVSANTAATTTIAH